MSARPTPAGHPQDTVPSSSSAPEAAALVSPSPSRDKIGRKRGGRRPGAGAPRGNLNAFRHGRRSGRVLRAFLVLAICPEVVEALTLLKQADARGYRRRFLETLAAAHRVARSDPDLARSINALVRERFRSLTPALAETLFRLPEQSDNQEPP